MFKMDLQNIKMQILYEIYLKAESNVTTTCVKIDRKIPKWHCIELYFHTK